MSRSKRHRPTAPDPVRGSTSQASVPQRAVGNDLTAHLRGGGLSGPSASLDLGWFEAALGSDPGSAAPEEQAALALRIAVDLLQGGNWGSAQSPPAEYADALVQLASICQPELPPQGDEALEALDNVRAGLEPATTMVDPGWVDQHYRSAMDRERRKHLDESSRSRVRELHEATRMGDADRLDSAGQAAVLAAKLDSLADSVNVVDAYLSTDELKLARKAGSQVGWAQAMTAPVYDPLTGNALRLSPTGTAIDDFLAIVKTALMAHSVATKGGKLLREGPEPVHRDRDAVAQAMDVVKLAGESTVVLTAAVAELTAAVCQALAWAGRNSDQAKVFDALAVEWRGVARAVHSAKGVTGILAAVDAVRCGLVLLDPQAEAEAKMDAAVGLVSAGAKIGDVVYSAALRNPGLMEPILGSAGVGALETVGPWMTPLSIAIPAGWWTFKASLQALGVARLGGTAAMMASEFEAMLDRGERLCDEYRAVAIAKALALATDDPERRASMERAEDAVAGDLVTAFQALERVVRGFRARTLREEMLGVLDDHSAAVAGEASADAVGEAVQAVAGRISWCIERARTLVATEAGLAGPEELDALLSARE